MEKQTKLDVEITELIGKTLISVKGKKGDDEIVFTTANGEQYYFYHRQDCCETVTIEDVCGDIDDLIGVPLVMAEEITHQNTNPPEVIPPEYQDSFTWTFYKFATIKGYVTIRWYGASNGYYSERVSIRMEPICRAS